MSAHLLPGFRWMAGMLTLFRFSASGPMKIRLADDVGTPGWEPDWSDPATGGCLVSLLGTEAWRVRAQRDGTWIVDRQGRPYVYLQSQGEACAAVAEALGRWPGGVS